MRIFTLFFCLFSLQLGWSQVSLVQDIVPGVDDGGPNNLFAYDGKVYFGADVDSLGRELWVSDGTTDGTMLVQDIRPGEDNSSPNFFFVLKDTLYFSANPGAGNVLFRTDGTDMGTVQAASTFVFNSVPVGDSIVYFISTTQDNQVFTFDGSNVAPLPNLGTGTERVLGATFTFYNGKLVLYMDYSEDEATVGRELYEYDFATQMFSLIKDVDQGDGDAGISEMVELGGLLYFEADNDLWVTDGTEAGTNPVSAVVDEGITSVRSMYAWKGQLYFEADSGSNDQLFVYTPATDTVRNLSRYDDINHDPVHFVPYNGYLYYAGKDSSDGEYYLYRTAGDNIEQVDTTFISVDDIARMGDTLYFEAEEEGVTGRELFRFFTPQLVATVADSLEVCAGDSLTIMASGAPSANWNYTWFADAAGMMPLDTTDMFEAGVLTEDSTFYVRIDSGNVEGELTPVFVDLNQELGDGASIALQGTDTLVASPNGVGFTYQWLDSARLPIDMATDSTFAPDTTGDYYVVVSGESCSDTSAVFAYSETSSIANFEGGFELFPNPSQGQLTLRWAEATSTAWQLQVTDLMGRIVLRQRVEIGTQTLNLNFSAQPTGTYLVLLRSQQGGLTRRWIKE